MCPTLIEIGSKTAEKNSAQTHRQTDKPTDTTKIMVTWLWTNKVENRPPWQSLSHPLSTLFARCSATFCTMPITLEHLIPLQLFGMANRLLNVISCGRTNSWVQLVYSVSTKMVKTTFKYPKDGQNMKKVYCTLKEALFQFLATSDRKM